MTTDAMRLRDARILKQGFCVWLTGLPASGKTTLATALAQALEAEGVASCILDGDVVRAGLNTDLGFSAIDRAESVRRVGETALLMAGNGLGTIVALISPFRRDREGVRARFAGTPFVEVYVETPLSVCESRDPKGHYKRARAGRLPNFTGIDSPYEPPAHPELRLGSVSQTIAEEVHQVMHHLRSQGLY